MRRAVFGIVGAGWRAEFFLRAAKELPEFLKVSIVVERNPEKGKRLEEQWGVGMGICESHCGRPGTGRIPWERADRTGKTAVCGA
ncbi:hypothetical protein AALH30_06040 [Blautia pseudococcoides]|uniref:hypothetical protein n=1 Tax=Blautia pseudococcoides TaxID=1796616 RepID=UPI00148B043E|nr:hypothetical protein [Blautia pseudococcoides]QJU15305.1 hypothetical protein HL650_13060 [Blautia pseudococcoides]